MKDSSQNLSIDHGGEAFYTDSLTIMHGQSKFVIDFKQVTPRLDQIGNDEQQTLKVVHNPILMEPQAAKVLLKVLEENIEKYEEEFGEIEVPERKQDESMGSDHDYIG